MSRFERWLVWGATAMVAATGLVYACMKHLLVPPDEFAVSNHPLQPLVLKLHILSAPVLVFAIGLITMRHILPRLRGGTRQARRSGLAGAIACVPMILTGYLIQAVSSAPLLTVLGWTHLALGAGFAFAAAGHVLAGRAGPRRRTDAAQSFSPWPAKSPRVNGRKQRSTASQNVLEKG